MRLVQWSIADRRHKVRMGHVFDILRRIKHGLATFDQDNLLTASEVVDAVAYDMSVSTSSYYLLPG